MSSLGDTVAALARRRRDAAALPRAAPTQRLVETLDFGPNPGALRMLSYAPATLAAHAPLVIALHGCSQSAQGYAFGSGWTALADRLGFALVCPEQRRANNANLCFNWFEPGDTSRGQGEAASIRQMTTHTLVEHDLDRARVFVTGLSAGGAMTAVMLATYPEAFAAGAIVAGLPYGAASNVQEAFGAMFQGRSRAARDWGDRVRAAAPRVAVWPRVSIWHGDADATVRPGAADELVRQWTDVHGLDAAGGVTTLEGVHTRRIWRDASGVAAVESHRIAGMGHGVPLDVSGAQPVGAAGPYLLDVGVSSTLEIAAFFGLIPEGSVVRSLPAPRAASARRLAPGLFVAQALRNAGLTTP